jgi:molybdopterin-containing oxidoreductase family membrane subunit
MFVTLFLLFMRFLPMVCAFEVKAVTPQADPHHEPEGGHDSAQPKEAAVAH